MTRRRSDRRASGPTLVASVVATLVASACAPAPEQIATGSARRTTVVVAPAGPPPVTVPEAAPVLLESPAAVPNGPGTALPASSPVEAPGSDAVAEPSGTVVGHAIVPLVTARVSPEAGAAEISSLSHPTERGVPLVFQVLQGPTDGWVEVLLPVRPNGTTGWVRADEVELTRNRYRLDLDVARRELVVFHNDEVLLSTTVAIGTGATPTPIGDFYLTELLRPPDPGGAYGPFAYGLSGFSETLDSFNGGPGIIGIHGTNRPDLLGTDVSHGCVRVHNEVITELATVLPLGTPVSIHRGRPTPPPPGLS